MRQADQRGIAAAWCDSNLRNKAPTSPMIPFSEPHLCSKRPKVSLFALFFFLRLS